MSSVDIDLADGDPGIDEAEAIRRDFALTWGRIGAAWGVASSTAAVQGYVLVHGGPLTRREIQAALGLSHRATIVAIADCEGWGIIERAAEKRRSGTRGPEATAWVPVGDEYEWFRRVAAARKERETDPVLPLLDDCLRRADIAGADELSERIATLMVFVRRFDGAVGAVVEAEAPALEHLFAVLERLDQDTLTRLLMVLQDVPEEDLAASATALSRMRPGLIQRALRIVANPRVGRVLGRAGDDP